ncbi:MAG: PQQ-binding-like beta-propeller repeat protein, partial [Planctomycetota bacterium]
AIHAAGQYGPVSVQPFDGCTLPLIDNLANLIVVEASAEVGREELLRVLVPGGVACERTANGWARLQKPKSEKLDDWTHCLYDATNNAVSHDREVAPPKHLQWVGGPSWTRHHDHMSSFNAMVSAGGRVFYIIDEGPRAEVQLPPRWVLVARDGFNGLVLWKRPIEKWHPHLWLLKSGPAQLPRRLVAVGNEVYVTLGIDAPVSVLDAATGDTLRTLEQTAGAEEILHAGDELLVLRRTDLTKRPWSTRETYSQFREFQSEAETWAWPGEPQEIIAIDPKSGETIWTHTAPVAPQTLGADAERVCFFDGRKIQCLDRSSGRMRWNSPPLKTAEEMRSWFAPTLVLQSGVVMFAGGEKIERHKGGMDTMTALDAATGQVLWTAEHPRTGYDSPEDIFVIDGVVWVAPTTNRRDTGTFVGRDLRTGEVKHEFPADDGDHMPHHRCHRARATEQFILASRTGVEYVDFRADHWDRNDWVRGACLYGIMPANGLTYTPQHSCACYVVAKLNGLNALAAERAPRPKTMPGNGAPRLERGSAYGEVPHANSTETDADWPTYRHDAARSGYTPTAIGSNLKLAWRTPIGGKLTPPVAAEGKVFVAAPETHTVHAVDRQTGKPAWHFVAGGRVDSPPTIWQGRVLFGASDGSIYCLRASDGALCWRYLAAPEDLRLVAWEQVESVWPVHGSVLVRDGVVHAIAGRSMFLDGGMRYVRLSAATGRLIGETTLDDRHPETGQPLDAEVHWPNLPVALPDVLSYDGRYVYMRSQRFDLEGNRIEVVAPTDFRDQQGEGAHLFSPTGFLDDSWWHRTYWMFGKSPISAAGGWYLAAYQAPVGRIMATDGERLYGFGRRPQYFPRTTALEYHVFATQREPKIVGPGANPKARNTAPGARPNQPLPSRVEFDWSYEAPAIGRALVLTGRTLFVAGPPDLVDQESTLESYFDGKTEDLLAEQAAAYAGEQGSILTAMSADDGALVGAYQLDVMPVFDGLIAAGGGLVMSTVDGSLVALGPSGSEISAAKGIELKPTELDAGSRGGGRAAVMPTKSHPDFQSLSEVQVEPAEMGWRLTSPPGKTSLALKTLDKPLTKHATFKLKMLLIPNRATKKGGFPPGNAFLAFGESPEDAQLIKCGLRSSGSRCYIIEGPLATGKQHAEPITPKLNEPIDVTVKVDLASGQVVLEMLGKRLEAKLSRPPRAIRHVGYALTSVSSEFGPVEIAGE